MTTPTPRSFHPATIRPATITPPFEVHQVGSSLQVEDASLEGVVVCLVGVEDFPTAEDAFDVASLVADLLSVHYGYDPVYKTITP